METLAKAGIAEGDTDERIRWDLIHMLHRRNQNDAAWDLLQGPPPLVPGTEHAALLWLQVHARTGRDRATVQQMLDVVAHFGDSEDVQGTALGLFYTLRGDRQVTDTEGAAVQELGARFIERWPQSAFLSAYKVTPDDPAELARQIDDIARLGLGRHKQVLDAIEMYAAARIPFGMVARVARLTVTEALLDRLGGFIVTSFNEEGSTGVDTATTAMGEVVAIDLTAAFCAATNDTTWVRTIGAFRRVVAANALVTDAAAAEAALSLDRGGHIGYDERNQRAVITGPDKDRDRVNRVRAEALGQRLGELDTASCSRIPLLPDLDDGRELSWLAPIQIAADSGIALLSDDQALRTLARSFGVRAFGTLDLIEALAVAGTITAGEAAIWRDTLHGVQATEIHTDVEALLESTAGLEVSVGALSRPWPWATPGAVDAIIRAADRAGAEAAALASYWFAIGACRHNPDAASNLVRKRITSLIGNLHTASTAAWAITAMRDACLDRGVVDPLPGAVMDHRDDLARVVGLGESNRLTVELLSGLAVDAQQVILRTIALT